MTASADLIHHSRYGDSKVERDILILCQHDDNGIAFLERFRDILSPSIADDEETLHRYLEVERDTGSSELAFAVAQKILRKMDKPTRIDILTASVPRGIIDLNRTADKAFRNVFRPKTEEITAFLHEIYSIIRREIRKHIASLIGEGGIFLDMHTMSPFSPPALVEGHVHSLVERPGHLDEYIDAYVLACVNGKRRTNDIVCSRKSLHDFFFETPADIEVLLHITRAFTRDQIDFAFNSPYSLYGHNANFHDMRIPGSRGIALDIDKSELVTSATPVECCQQLDALTIDPQKVARMATPIADALVQTLQNR